MASDGRYLGLAGATGIGVGAIVGGGILGLQRWHRRRKVFGDLVLHLARHTRGPLLMISRGG